MKPIQPMMNRKRRSAGFTLLELSIAITLGLIILVGVTYAYLGNRQTYVMNEEMARAHESARVALDVLGNHLRLGGGLVCQRNVDLWNAPNFLVAVSGDDMAKDFVDRVNKGKVVEVASSLTAVAGLDGKKPSLRVYTLSSSGVAAVDVAEAAGTDITVGGGITPHKLYLHATGGSSSGLQNPYMLINDCDKAVLFKAKSITSLDTAGGKITLNGTGLDSLNSTVDRAVFGRGAQVIGMLGGADAGSTSLAQVFEVRDSGRVDLTGQPIKSLFHNSEELVEGVEAFRVCVDGDRDGTYGLKNLESVTDEKEWQKIKQVQVDLVLASIRPRVLPDKVKANITLCGDDTPLTAPEDYRLRRLFSTSFALRSRIGLVEKLDDEEEATP